MRLNKYIAHCGICNRRQAVPLIKGGLVRVNDEVIKNPAYLVQDGEVVKYKLQIVEPLEPKIYVLMNKPKNVSVHSEANVRKSILDIVQPKYEQKLSPVGLLENMHLGLLLLTNDTEVIEKFNLPDAEYVRVYHLTFEEPLSLTDLIQIKETTTVEGKKINISNIDFLDEEDKRTIGIELLQGSIGLVQSLMKSKNYTITKLDCMNFANLTKRDLPRGWFRDLKPKEIVMLKHFV